MIWLNSAACGLDGSVMSVSLLPHGLQSARLLCQWGFPGKNTGMSCHFLLQGIFPTQGLNPGFLHCSQSVSSVTQSCPTLRLHRLQHTRPPCPSPTSGVYSNSYPLSQWCHPTTSSFVVPFSSCPQSFPASGSFQMSQFFISGGQSIGVSASVLPMNIQDWFPLGWTGWISLQSKGLSRVFCNTTVQKHQYKW